ncbi:MAG: copper resistance protein B [Gammaproteobacteria bacterium]|nr:copper resistance protein B [Gammaproteobacteria bacterium]MBK9426776.1 copper resistance protein B [Gammaproteobacteria bacterium]
MSDVELGLRLRYEIRREFAPYIGVVGWRKFGNSADFARNLGERSDDLELVIGAKFWF